MIINEEEEYEVEEVWKHRTRGWRTQYLIHWKGYGDECYKTSVWTDFG